MMPSVKRWPERRRLTRGASRRGIAARAGDRTVIDREDHGVALAERHDLGARLHPRPGFDKHELAAGEIPAGSAEQDRGLHRENQVAIEVLVQAVVVAVLVFQQQRRRAQLARFVTAREKGVETLGKARLQAQPPVPFIGKRR